MTPPASNPCFRHEPEEASCSFDAVRSKPIPTDPNGGGIAKAAAAERSLAGNSNDAMSAQQPVGGRVVKFLLPPKKRAMSDTSSSDQSGADGSFVVPPKKRRADTGPDGTSAYGIPAQTHQFDMVTTATATSPKPSNSKAITIVTPRQPPRQHKKLMHDGIRSGGVAPWRDFAACDDDDEYMEQADTSAAGAARAKKNRNRNTGKSNRPPRPAWEPVALVPANRTLRPSEELSRRLEELGTTTGPPTFVCMKTLSNSDVCKNQNRLLFSCKPEFVEDHPITAHVDESRKEAYLVNECETGLTVSTFDGHGAAFVIRLKYLGSNGGYRLITGWHAFVVANKLDAAFKKKRRVDVELWAFRSRGLPGQPVLQDKDRHKQPIVEGLEDHPDGALGLLFIPYLNGVDISNNAHHAEEQMAAEEEETDEEEEEEIEERAPPPVHETKRQAAAKAVREERRVAERARANRGKAVVARQMTIEEVIEAAGEELAAPLLGLLTLSSRCCSSAPMLTLDNNNNTHRSSGTTV